MRIMPLKGVLSLLKRLRWILALTFLIAAAGLAWYGWYSGSVLAWVVFGILLLPLLAAGIWGGRIILWPARRLEQKVLHEQKMVTGRIVEAGMQQGEKLVQIGSKAVEREVKGTRQMLEQARNRLDERLRIKPGTVTWITVPPVTQDAPAFCLSCGHALRKGAKFCDQCGKPITHS